MTVRFEPDAPPPPTRDAATVLLLRDGAEGLEVFMVKRSADARFMGGAFVFPGGKLDEDDADPALAATLDAEACAARLCEPDDPARARALHVAAARECLEESGVLHTTTPIDAALAASLRHRCDVDHVPLAALLAEHALALELRALRPLARWITPREETRRFDARFFVAAAPPHLAASHEGRENVASAWLRPSDALARAARGEIVLVPPTYRTLQELAAHTNAEQALDAAPRLVPTIAPQVRAVPDGFLVVLPDDPLFEHPPESATMANERARSGFATRFEYRNGAWLPSKPVA